MHDNVHQEKVLSHLIIQVYLEIVNGKLFIKNRPICIIQNTVTNRKSLTNCCSTSNEQYSATFVTNTNFYTYKSLYR